MEERELKALVTLVNDSDREVREIIEQKILSLGTLALPFLEDGFHNSGLDADLQNRLSELIHLIQFSELQKRLKRWYNSESKDLLTGLWLVAQYQYPELELKDLKAKIDQLYFEVWAHLRSDTHTYDQIKILNDILLNKIGFEPNTKNFHSPGNSMINVVLDSKKGNPISLCCVYLLVAEKLNIPLYGVNLPNMFVLLYNHKGVRFYINVFNKGVIFSRSDIDNYLKSLKLPANPIFYEACSTIDIIRRVLRNLMVSFQQLGEKDKVYEVKSLLESIMDDGQVADPYQYEEPEE